MAKLTEEQKQQLTSEQKQQIIQLVREKKSQLKTMSAVATFCSVSESAISQLVDGKYEAKGDNIFLKIGNALGWKPNGKTGRRDWSTVETMDCRNIVRMCCDAKSNSLFLALSENAGVGKSEGLMHMYHQYKNADVYYIRCMDWGKTDFLLRLCRTLGINTSTGVRKPNDLLELVIEFFQQRGMNKPLLIADEANKLKDSAMRCLIPLYNECEDFLGVVMSGPEDLQKSIETGIRYKKRGYDEIYSRFGRTFVKLLGATVSDVIAICKANGFDDVEKIRQKFEDHQPISRIIKVSGKESRIRVLKDLRWIKTFVKVNRNKTA